MYRELDEVSSARAWVTTVSHLVAATALVVALRQPLGLIWLALVLLGYVFFIIALMISLMAQVPSVRKLWEDPFFKVCTLALPFPIAFLAKGFASEWVGELTSSSASNFPMAYVTATCFVLLVGVFIGLSVALLVFEVLFIAMVTRGKKTGPTFWSKETLQRIFAMGVRQRLAARQHSKVIRKRAGALGLSLFTFLACLFGIHTISALFSSRVGNVLLLATVFDFDGAPATRCALTEEEKKLADRRAPILKAVFLSTAQDKALLMERSSRLFEPVVLTGLRQETGTGRTLTFGRVAKCYETDSK